MVTIICGDNSWAVSKKSAELIQKFVQVHGSLALEEFEGEQTSSEQLKNALTSLPFLATNKLVVVRRLSENKELMDDIESLLPLSDDTTDLLIIEGSLDKRKNYYKLLKKQKGFQEQQSVSGPALTIWLVGEAKNKEAHITPSDAQYLIDRVGQDQSLLSNEVDKLAMYDKNITKDTINLLCEASPESTVFELLSAAFEGKSKTALLIYEQQRQQKVEAFAILNMMTWQLHQMALVKSCGLSNPNEIARSCGISPYSASKSLQLLRGRNIRNLLHTASSLIEIEYRTKTSSYDIDQALKTLIVSL
ncbi:MAG: DNA polymerase III subunit delta [bacterium]|nr:DNA polymerase III subunit delta [bacterium]